MRAKRPYTALSFACLVAVSVAGCGQNALTAGAAPPAAVVVERAPEHDVALLIKVKDALVAEPELRRFGLEVGVQGGVVTLYGEVATRAQRDKAEHIARNISGVAVVKSGIAVTQAA